MRSTRTTSTTTTLRRVAVASATRTRFAKQRNIHWFAFDRPRAMTVERQLCHRAKKKDEIPLEERNIKKVRAVEATREHGKQLFGEGKYEHAAAVFDRGLLIINGSYSMTDEQQAKLDDLELILESNLAACKLKLERNVEAIRHCKAVLSRDKTNAKAMYRWAEALITMGEYEDARDKVRESIKAHPNNAGFRQQLARVKTLIAQQRDKERQSLLEMQRKMAANKQ
eukprot:TRINITY_DN57045_c0_g1_i1.p1 TRINITY_DN57045_c0_g1~~TRINITY_DN57045_c0_g1_i1.p1  ORF type:complete len:226 (-),score=90.85 TRINITY_DN57045_c0_g1_i1:88-765(-)